MPVLQSLCITTAYPGAMAGRAAHAYALHHVLRPRHSSPRNPPSLGVPPPCSKSRVWRGPFLYPFDDLSDGHTMAMQNPVVRLRFDRFELDEANARLTCAGVPVPLAPTPFAVLCTLARAPWTLLTKHALLDAVWGHRFFSESVLKQAISEVRAALGDDPKQPRYVATVARRGYRFIGTAVDAPFPGAPAVGRSGTSGSDHSNLAALTALSQGDPVVANLVRAFGATLERERLAPGDLDVYNKVLRWLIELARERPEQMQPVRWQAFARALD